METQISIPSKERKEWGQILRKEIEHSFQNFVLQMTVHKLQNKLKDGQLTEQEAIDELFELCSKYALAAQNDCISIFKEW